MRGGYRVLTTSAFRRDVGKTANRNRDIPPLLARLFAVLERDPMNISRRHDIKKLSGVKSGEGQWRTRGGDYRLRYDVIAQDVALYSFRHRREAY